MPPQGRHGQELKGVIQESSSEVDQALLPLRQRDARHCQSTDSVVLPGSEKLFFGYALILASTITQNRPITASNQK